MNESNSSNQSVQEGELLLYANNILGLLNYSSKLENEEDLFSDEFYISIIGNILVEDESELKPGKTKEEKAKSLKNLIESLSAMIETDLSSIDGEAIVLKHDKKSAKKLLVIINELIETMIKVNLAQQDDEEDVADIGDLNNSDILQKNRMNLSEDKMHLNKDEEIDIDTLKSLKLGKDSKNEDVKKSDKKESSNLKESSNKKKNLDVDDDDDLNNNIENENEKELVDMNLFNNSDVNAKVNHISDLDKESSLKKSNDIPNLLGDNQDSDSEEELKKNKYKNFDENENTSDFEKFNYEQPIAYSVPQSMQRAHLSNVSEENLENIENELQKKIIQNEIKEKEKVKEKEKEKEKEKQKEKEESIVTNSDVSNSGKNNKKKSNKKKSEQNSTASKKQKINSSQKKNSNENSKKQSDDKKVSEKKNAEAEEKNGEEGEEKNSQEGVENSETSLNEDGYEIMKEFKKIYGEKFDNIFLKQNVKNSSDIFQLVLRNIKLAQQRMMKIENRIPEVVDLKTKEYMQRYEKELQMMLINYDREQKKMNFFQERAIKNFNRNLKDLKKIKEIEAKKVDSEIERRRKAKEVRSHHNQLKFCNEIYQRALQLEKEKNLENVKLLKEINKKENQEKRLAMDKIENYYKTQIKLLKEMLEKEKKERDLEHRAHLQVLSKLEKERRDEYKQQLENIFDKFDQQEKKMEFENRTKNVNQIFDAYYQ